MYRHHEINKFEKKFSKSDGCWNWEYSLTTTGYGQLGFCEKIQKAHRVSWMLYRGDIPSGMCVLHRCDNRKCVNPDHLYIGDALQNAKDKYNRGRANHPAKKNHHAAKLTENDIVSIQEMSSKKSIYQKDIAKIFAVTPATISYIINGKRWAS